MRGHHLEERFSRARVGGTGADHVHGHGGCGGRRGGTGGATGGLDAAQVAFDKGDWNASIAGFTVLLPADPARPLGRSEAVIATRLGYALIDVGRAGEARSAIARALAVLSEHDRALYLEALMAAGDAARFSFDYADAAEDYRRARALAETLGDRPTLVRAAMSTAYAATTIDPVSVGRDLDALLGDKATQAAIDKKQIALIEDLRGRAALNAGDLARRRNGSIGRSIIPAGLRRA